MNDFKMNVILAILSSIIFSLVFILLAFVLPTVSEDPTDINTYSKIKK